MNDVPETEMPVAEVYELRLYVAGQSPKSVTASLQHRAHPGGVATAARETRRLSNEFGWQGSAGAMYVCGRELKEPHAGGKAALMTKPDDEADGSMKAFEKSLAKTPKDERYVLRLYVTGMTPRSTQAFASIKAICEEHLEGRYELEVIDIYQHPHLAKDEQIIAAPTLVKKFPAPLRRLIGDLSNKERVLLALDLRRKS